MDKWKDLCIGHQELIQKAMGILDQLGSKRIKTLIVVDKDFRLKGTVTDGDIRRGILKNISLNGEVHEIINRTPVVYVEGESNWSQVLRKAKARSAFQIPVVRAETYEVVILRSESSGR